jgi:hypothetical protein
VDETFYQLAEAALLCVNPFDRHLCQGYHIPSEDLLQWLYDHYQHNKKEAGWQFPQCILQ